MAKALPKYVKDLTNLKKHEQVVKEMEKNIVILENGEKFMEDGLETKDTSFPVN